MITLVSLLLYSAGLQYQLVASFAAESTSGVHFQTRNTIAMREVLRDSDGNPLGNFLTLRTLDGNLLKSIPAPEFARIAGVGMHNSVVVESTSFYQSYSSESSKVEAMSFAPLVSHSKVSGKYFGVSRGRSLTVFEGSRELTSTYLPKGATAWAIDRQTGSVVCICGTRKAVYEFKTRDRKPVWQTRSRFTFGGDSVIVSALLPEVLSYFQKDTVLLCMVISYRSWMGLSELPVVGKAPSAADGTVPVLCAVTLTSGIAKPVATIGHFDAGETAVSLGMPENCIAVSEESVIAVQDGAKVWVLAPRQRS